MNKPNNGVGESFLQYVLKMKDHYLIAHIPMNLCCFDFFFTDAVVIDLESILLIIIHRLTNQLSQLDHFYTDKKVA